MYLDHSSEQILFFKHGVKKIFGHFECILKSILYLYFKYFKIDEYFVLLLKYFFKIEYFTLYLSICGPKYFDTFTQYRPVRLRHVKSRRVSFKGLRFLVHLHHFKQVSAQLFSNHDHPHRQLPAYLRIFRRRRKIHLEFSLRWLIHSGLLLCME